MKVVLVLPPFDVSASWGSARKMKEGVLAPLGVGYLAASLESHGHTARLIDAPALGLDIKQTADAIFAENPDVIGISALTIRANSAYALANAIKAQVRDVPVVMGGPHVTVFWGSILSECANIDVLVPGEGELVFAEFVDSLSAKRSYTDVRGLVYRDDKGKLVATPPAEVVEDLDSIAHPARHIYNKELYRPLPNQGRRLPSAIMISSRGCPWARCKFCYQGGRYAWRYRRRSPEDVIDEICHLVRDLGYREVMFWDENFCINRQWVYAFCDLLDREELNIPWTVEGHVKTADPNMFKRISASGCYNIFFGFESGNQEILDLVDKGITLDECRQTVTWAKEAGLEIRGSFMLGFPTETPEMGEKTIRFACELDTDFTNFVPFHIWPGLPLEEFALREGRQVEWDDSLLAVTYVPNAYSGPEELAALLKSAYRRYYFRPRYIARALWALRKPGQLERYWLGSRYWLGLMRRRNS